MVCVSQSELWIIWAVVFIHTDLNKSMQQVLIYWKKKFWLRNFFATAHESQLSCCFIPIDLNKSMQQVWIYWKKKFWLTIFLATAHESQCISKLVTSSICLCNYTYLVLEQENKPPFLPAHYIVINDADLSKYCLLLN